MCCNLLLFFHRLKSPIKFIEKKKYDVEKRENKNNKKKNYLSFTPSLSILCKITRPIKAYQNQQHHHLIQNEEMRTKKNVRMKRMDEKEKNRVGVVFFTCSSSEHSSSELSKRKKKAQNSFFLSSYVPM